MARIRRLHTTHRQLRMVLMLVNSMFCFKVESKRAVPTLINNPARMYRQLAEFMLFGVVGLSTRLPSPSAFMLICSSTSIR